MGWDKNGHYVDDVDPNKNPGNLPPGFFAGGWEADQKKRVQASQDAIDVRNKNILNRPAPTLNDTSPYADQLAAARANQMQSLGLLRNSAMGQGPSYANAQSAIALGQGLGRLGMTQPNALAARQNLMAGNQALGQAVAEGGLARGKEMGAALGAYGTGAQAVRGGDLAGQQAAQQQIGRQQALALQAGKSNQGLVQGLEGLDMDWNLAQSKDAQDWYNLWLQKNSAQADQNMKETQAAIQTMAAAAAMAASDRRVKKAVR